jgi:hypothetical protein
MLERGCVLMSYDDFFEQMLPEEKFQKQKTLLVVKTQFGRSKATITNMCTTQVVITRGVRTTDAISKVVGTSFVRTTVVRTKVA